MKAEGAIATTPGGMKNDESDEQHRNAEFSMRDSLDSDVNVIVVRSEHRSKQ
jgi:hypothetical protein